MAAGSETGALPLPLYLVSSVQQGGVRASCLMCLVAVEPAEPCGCGLAGDGRGCLLVQSWTWLLEGRGAVAVTDVNFTRLLESLALRGVLTDAKCCVRVWTGFG